MGPRYYLAGRYDNKAFNEELTQVIAHHTLGPYLFVCCTSDAWADRLPDIFPGRTFKKRQRSLYTLHHLAIPNWRTHIAPGFSIRRIDRQLLQNKDLANLSSLTEEIQSTWPTTHAFLNNAFGFCAVRAAYGITCWCTAEHISGTKLGIGIETAKEYQHQNLATLTATAFAEHCLSTNTQPHWDSWTNNTPSIRVAEKTGFQKLLDYDVYQGH